MISSDEVSAALDSSGNEIFLSVLRGEKELFFEKATLESRASSKLLAWISDSLDAGGVKIMDVRRWTLGTGPNSYSSLRVLSSLISGLLFENQAARGRGLPSASSLAFNLFKSPLAPDSIAVIFPIPSIQAVFYQHFEKANGHLPLKSGFLGESNEIPDFPERSIYFALEKDAEMICAIKKSGKLPVNFEFSIVKNFPTHELALVNPEQFDDASMRDLIYLRPPAELKSL